MNIIKYTSTIDTSAYANRPIKYIVIHYTAGTQSRKGAARSACDWWKQPATQASADFVVDDAEIVQYNPDIKNRYCWHCGGSKYNTKGGKLYGAVTNVNSIGIELCSSNSTKNANAPANSNVWYFTDAVLKNGAELTKYLMEKYNVPLDRVVRHYDVTGKLCPGIYGWNADSGSEAEWQKFKARLTGNEVMLENAPTPQIGSKPAQVTGYLVRVTTDALNIRKGPSTSYQKNGIIHKGEIYTIVEEQNGWGKLKSGAGWISLAYTQKV